MAYVMKIKKKQVDGHGRLLQISLKVGRGNTIALGYKFKIFIFSHKPAR